MNPLDFDPAYSAGIRNLLITTATSRAKRRRHLPWTIGLTITGLSLLGAGGAVAANYLIPGADIVTSLNDSHTITGAGPATLTLEHAPDGTNSLEYSVHCDSAGSITFPDGSSLTCNSSDARNPKSLTVNTAAWTPDSSTFHLDATTGMRWRFTYSYSDHQTSDLATNANGQTYGIDTDTTHPDLIAATATNGRQGYINSQEAAELDQSNPSHFHSPAEAVQWQEAHPNYSVDIPVYLSDGTTKIDTFRIGGN